MSDLIQNHSHYVAWVSDLKQQFRQMQQKAIIQVNASLLTFYWQLGEQIIQQQAKTAWGDGFLEQLSRDLMSEFPEMKGFSVRNLKYMRQWRRFYDGMIDETNRQQLVAELSQIPWGHHIVLISKCKNQQVAKFYLTKTKEFGWSRNVLLHHIDSGLYEREGNALSNFAQTLPPIQSDLAQQTFKDPYLFDFLSLGTAHSERELENALVKHITDFLVELGAGFAYVGKQVHLEVGDQDFYLDLLFYHLKLRAYVVIELKAGEFKPEYAGKLSFYLSAVDAQLKTEQDQPTIGLLLCKTKNKVIAEYTLRDNARPIGIAEYQLAQALPKDLEDKLPSIALIESELAKELEGAN